MLAYKFIQIGKGIFFLTFPNGGWCGVRNKNFIRATATIELHTIMCIQKYEPKERMDSIDGFKYVAHAWIVLFLHKYNVFFVTKISFQKNVLGWHIPNVPKRV